MILSTSKDNIDHLTQMTTQCSDWNKIINFQKKSLGWEYSSVVESSGSARPLYDIKKKITISQSQKLMNLTHVSYVMHTSPGLSPLLRVSIPQRGIIKN